MTRSYRALLPLVLLLPAPAVSLAQSVSGQVIDEATVGPVPGVAVTLLDSAGGVVAQQVTQGAGRYALTAPAAGRYRLRFMVPGYRVLVTPLLNLEPGRPLEYPLSLRAMAPSLLDTLLVEGRPVPWNLVGFYQRRKVGLGYFATEEDWNHWAVVQIKDVIRHLYPFTQPGGHSCSGWPIYMDGMPMPSDFDTDDWFLNDFAAIEVHRSPYVPPEFSRAMGVYEVCGVTALWSRLDRQGRTTHLDVGAHAGTALAGTEGGRGRAGIQATLGLGAVLELHLAYSAIVSTLDPSSVTSRSGWEIIGAVRAHPFGEPNGWYVGLGGRAGGLRATGTAPSTEEQNLVGLSGWELPVGRLRPYLELEVLSPLSSGSRVFTTFAGVSVRIY